MWSDQCRHWFTPGGTYEGFNSLRCEDPLSHTGFDLIGLPLDGEHHATHDGIAYTWVD